MKPEEQRIAILQLLGWSELTRSGRRGDDGPQGALRGRSPEGVANQVAPNPLINLNAMHEAEKVLDGETIANEPPHLTQYDRYLIALDDITPDSVRATAPQRAEALLRTLSLWKP